jgi:hypothetical protein
MKKHVKHLLGWLAVWCTLMVLPVHYGNAQSAPAGSAKLAQEEGDEGKGCCAYTLQFINLYEAKYIKKIRVTAMCDTRICCADPDEWAQAGNSSEFVEWFPADSTAVPYGNAIDNEFLIYLSSTTSPYFLQVEWFDMDDNIVCRHNIEISCDGPFKEEDEDWTQYTSKTPLNDDRLFVFAVREDEEDEDACEDFLKAGFCLIDYSITCSGIDNYLVSLDAPDGFELYQWAIVSGPETPSISSNQHTSVLLTLPGTYVISMLANHLDTGESCATETEVVIPGFSPGFTTARVPNPCSQTIRFTPNGAFDPSSVAGVTWQCVGVPGFPSYCSYGGSVDYTFTVEGTYIVTMTIMDNFGCAHSTDPIPVVVSFDCHAAAEVDKYYLCAGCEGQANIQVLFNNTSTGGTCPLTFTWDFGDGTPTVTTNETQLSVPHTYSVPNCAATNNYSVTITMTDSSPDPCTSTAVVPLVIAPCRPDVTWKVCPTGKVCFTASVPGKWTFPSTLQHVSGNLDEDTEVCMKACTEGSFPFTFEGFCNTGGRCIISRTLIVDELVCCAKNDAQREHYEFSGGGTDYRMKYKMVQRNFLIYHRIRLKTKLKKHKNLWGIGYWKGTKADQIEAHCVGTVYKSDSECTCVLPHDVNDGVVKYNKKKAKKNIAIGEPYRSRLNSIMSTHRVIKAGQDIIKYLYLGVDCDESCQ